MRIWRSTWAPSDESNERTGFPDTEPWTGRDPRPRFGQRPRDRGRYQDQSGERRAADDPDPAPGVLDRQGRADRVELVAPRPPPDRRRTIGDGRHIRAVRSIGTNRAATDQTLATEDVVDGRRTLPKWQ